MTASLPSLLGYSLLVLTFVFTAQNSRTGNHNVDLPVAITVRRKGDLATVRRPRWWEENPVRIIGEVSRVGATKSILTHMVFRPHSLLTEVLQETLRVQCSASSLKGRSLRYSQTGTHLRRQRTAPRLRLGGVRSRYDTHINAGRPVTVHEHQRMASWLNKLPLENLGASAVT